jgi:hypothetical protein
LLLPAALCLCGVGCGLWNNEMILGCHFSIGWKWNWFYWWNDGIDFINGMMEWFYKKFNCIVYVLKHIENIIVLWIAMYNKRLITIIKWLITGLIWVDSWIVELCIWNMNFLLMYFKIPYDFTILRSEFVLHFPCRVKIVILTTLITIII